MTFARRYNSPRSNVQRRKRNALAKAIAIVAVPASLLAAGAVWVNLVEHEYAYGADLCLENRPLTAHTVLVIDRSDPVSGNEKAFLKSLVAGIKDDLAPNERFSIYAIDNGHVRVPSRLFSLCNPGTAEQANVLAQTPVRVQQTFDEKFARPISRIIDDLRPLGNTDANQSPIMETLLTLSQVKDFGPDMNHRRLILVSDMIQHSDEFSQIRTPVDFEAFRSAHGDLIGRRLENVDVTVHYLLREQRAADGRVIQGPVHLAFWRSYFDAAGANLHIEINR